MVVVGGLVGGRIGWGGGGGLVGGLAGVVTWLALCSESEPAVGPVGLSDLKVWC